MAKKQGNAPKDGAKRQGKQPEAQEPQQPAGSDAGASTEQPQLPEPHGNDSSAVAPSPEAVSGSPSAPSEPPNMAQALSVLDQAAEAASSQPSASAGPSAGGASDAAASLAATAAGSAAAGDQPQRRKGGWPKGRPRKPSSDSPTLPGRSAAGAGTAASSLTESQLRSRVAELEAAADERALAGVALGLTQLTRVGFALVARRQGTHWMLQDGEAKEIGEAFAVALQPYLSYIGPALPFVVAVGTLYGAIAPRLEIETEITQGKRQRVLPGVNDGTA